MKTIETIVKYRTLRIEVSREDIIDALRNHFQASAEVPPRDACVFVEVPGGGDWAGAELSIDDSPLVIQWEESEKVR